MDRMNGKGGSCSMYLKVNIYTTGMYDNSMNGGARTALWAIILQIL